jgi:hypothetical protein
MRARGYSLSTFLALGIVAGMLASVPSAAPAFGAPGDNAAPALIWIATVDGRDVRSIDANEPVRLVPRDGAEVTVAVTNRGTAPVDVRNVRLDGQVLGLTFFSYTTRVDLTVPPGGTGERRFLVDLADLQGQATGLLPARLTLLDDTRATVREARLTVDVRGSVLSVYGMFGIAAAAITAFLLAMLLFRLATHRLPANRWIRATRFLAPGVGVGVTLTFTLSALRILTPNPVTWLLLIVLCGLVAFGLGYLSPTPDTGDVDAADTDEDGGAGDDRTVAHPPDVETPTRPWPASR